MSYFNGSSSGNNPLAFPSYNQQRLNQGNVAGLGTVNNSVSQIDSHFNGSSLNSTLQQTTDQATDRAGSFINPQDQISNDRSPNEDGGRTERQEGTRRDTAADAENRGLKRDRQNRPGQKFGAKKRSWVWTWFVQDPNDQNVAVCDFCGKVITRVASDRGSPKKLSEHLHTHKLTKNSINPSRQLPIDSTGLSFNASLQIPYAGTFSPQQGNGGILQAVSSISQGQLGLPSPSQRHSSASGHHASLAASSSQAQASQQLMHQSTIESADSGLKQNQSKYRRTNSMAAFANDMQHIHPQLQNHTNVQSLPNSSITGQVSRRYPQTTFESSPYSGSKFHRHLLKFLAENKLSVRLLKSPSFQQLVYDLRPESITDLLDLTGLYTSFVEIARGENSSETPNTRESSVAEASVVNTLARELTKK
ncbi:hypothetical protein OXX69_003203 [Metschnikowia pulcherrima]